MWVLVIIAATGMTTIPGFTDVRACYAAISDIDQKVGLLGKPIGPITEYPAQEGQKRTFAYTCVQVR